MISELAGYTLSRTIPDSTLLGVLSGSYKIYGGVIRNETGQIVSHLVNAQLPNIISSTILAPASGLISAFNTYQLHNIGTNVKVIMGLAQNTMILSGLTLAASAAGFLFLNRRLNKVDEKLGELAKDINYIKQFLELNERSRLATALNTISALNEVENENTRHSLLISCRQTLGEINEKYKMLMLNKHHVNDILPIEEYYTATALGHALCSAELGMYEQAANDIKTFHANWNLSVRNFVNESVLSKNPQRLLSDQYSKKISSQEIFSWIDFAKEEERGIDQLDDLRFLKYRPRIFSKPSQDEIRSIEVARKLVARNEIIQGYSDQYRYYASIKKKPSELQKYFDSLSADASNEGIYMFHLNTDQSEPTVI